MSSFQVGATTVTFSAESVGFTERKTTILRTWDMTVLLANATDYTNFVGLWSLVAPPRICPGSAGATAYVQIAGGAGKGTLTLDNVVGSPFTAALTRIERPTAYPGGQRRCSVSFQEAP